LRYHIFFLNLLNVYCTILVFHVLIRLTWIVICFGILIIYRGLLVIPALEHPIFFVNVHRIVHAKILLQIWLISIHFIIVFITGEGLSRKRTQRFKDFKALRLIAYCHSFYWQWWFHDIL
jgi:hypothetical protein